MLPLLISVLLSQEPSVRGEAGDPAMKPVTEEARGELRGRFGVGVVGGGSYGGGSVGAGPGISLEGGLTVHDRIGVGVRLSAMTITFAHDFRLVLAIDYSLSDQVSLGTGIGGMLIAGIQPLATFNLVVPLRVTVSPLTRPADKVGRSSLIFGFEVSPGVTAFAIASVAGSELRSRFAIGGQLTIGWMWW